MTKLLFTLAIVFCLLPTAVAAAVFTVTKETDDDGPCDPDDCALREAVLAANAAAGPDVILLPGGTYRLALSGFPGENASLTGDLDLLDDVEIRGDPLQPVVIEGTFQDERVIQTAFSAVEISNVTITGGNSLGGGGGVSIVDGDLVVRTCTITGNRAREAGGLQATISRVTVIDSTISGNTATFRGGGIFSTGSPITPSSLTLINTTVSGNVAGSGGGIYAFDTADRRLINSTITGNEARVIDGVLLDLITSNAMHWTNTLMDDDCGFIFSPAPTSGGGNMESPGATCYFPDPTDQMNVPDLLLGPLADNGGPTPTHALLPGSPAIDAGVDAGCPSTDQRGFARPADGDLDTVARCDVGAYELGGASPSDIPVLDRHGLLVLALLLAAVASASFSWSRNGPMTSGSLTSMTGVVSYCSK